MAHSIAFLKFKSTIELEIRAFWHLLTALDISNRTVGGYTSKLLTDEPGNAGQPFSQISIAPKSYLEESDTISGYVRENSIVSIITSFESYLFELMERIIYLQPDSISDSDMSMTAAEIASAATSKDARRWIASKVADRYLRNKTHTAMIKKLDKLARMGISDHKKTQIEQWHKWTLVRNSIVHTTRQVTRDLSNSWNSKFPTPGAAFDLSNKDVSGVYTLAIELAEAIDAMATKQAIKKSDAYILAKELFVHRGITSPAQIKKSISDAGIQIKLTNDEINKTISLQRRGIEFDTLSLTATEMQRILPI